LKSVYKLADPNAELPDHLVADNQFTILNTRVEPFNTLVGTEEITRDL